MKTLKLTTYTPEETVKDCELERIPEVLKEQINSCFRSPFFSEDNRINCFGPFTMTFAVRTAKNILLEGCDYQGLEIKVESSGHILPALPAFAELKKLLDASDTIIHINNRIYKPNEEIFSFQQVYDDAAKCIENVKKLGFTNEAIAIYATPDDITVEINASALGLEGNDELSSRYYKLLCHLAEIKEAGGKPQKTSIKTIILNTVLPKSKILLPGSIHPVLKRTKVGIGASHFAYGIAAFSDTCGKKRSLEECLQETLNWLNFINKELTPVVGIRELLDKIPKVAYPNTSTKTTTTISSPNTTKEEKTPTQNQTKSFIGVFQPLKSEIEAASNEFKEFPEGIKAFNQGLNKTLGKGWSIGGLHIILGSMEKGKASLLLQQAIMSENKMPVLYVSYEQSLKAFVTNAACIINEVNKTEMIAGLVGPNSSIMKLTLSNAIDKLQAKLSQNLFFSGIEAGRTKFNADEILELATMLPAAAQKLIIIESVPEDDLSIEQLQKLKSSAINNNLTIIMSVHIKPFSAKRLNYIEEEDITYLSIFQRFSDSIINMVTERTNLRKFVALVKGQTDTALVNSLEQKALQYSGGKRLKNDTYTLLRFIHNRFGKRDMMLYLYQADLGRFFELASVPLTRP